MAQDFQALHAQLGRLLAAPPDLNDFNVLHSPVGLQWLGSARALYQAIEGEVSTIARFQTATNKLPYGTYKTAVKEVFALLYEALASAELRAPAGTAGTFIPVGTPFDAYAAISKLLKDATRDVLIVDPYLDETVLTEFGQACGQKVVLRLLADEANFKMSLRPAATRWVAQYKVERPLEVRLAPARTLHDRAIFLDGAKAWTVTQSLKDLAARSPAEIIRADDTAELKIAAYEDIWSKSKVLV